MAGLRERKKEQTRQALSWAAVKLSVERGYENVLVEDIAAEAGVSPRTFNNYFASKGEAIAARHVDRIYEVARRLRERPAASQSGTRSPPPFSACTTPRSRRPKAGPKACA
jgi:AcrR family transcriptional regulator